jgi:hypothetical protein
MPVERYRKKPIVVEAVQWTGENIDEITAFLGEDFVSHHDRGDVFVCTKEDVIGGGIGYWFIRGVEGEHYPCAPAIFEATYERVEETPVTAEGGDTAKVNDVNG